MTSLDYVQAETCDAVCKAEDEANTRLGYVKTMRVENILPRCRGRIPAGHKGIMVDSGTYTNTVVWDRLPLCINGCEQCLSHRCIRHERISPRKVIIIG